MLCRRHRIQPFPLIRSCWIAGLLAMTPLVHTSVCAHGPFDSNARITVMETTIEATAVLGTDLARTIFAQSHIAAPPGQGNAVPNDVAVQLFRLANGDETLTPKEVRIFSDGLETAFVVTYPRPNFSNIRLEAKFARWLPASNQCALLVTDDQNQRLGSHVISLSSPITEFAAPQKSSPASEVAAAPSTPLPPIANAKLPAPTSPATKPAAIVPLLPIILVAVLVTLGGWWLARYFNHRETN